MTFNVQSTFPFLAHSLRRDGLSSAGVCGGTLGAEGVPRHEWSVRTCAGDVGVIANGDGQSGGGVTSVVGALTLGGSIAAAGGRWDCGLGA